MSAPTTTRTAPIPTRAGNGSLARESPWGMAGDAMSVPHLRAQLELHELEVCDRVARLRRGQEAQLVEVVAEGQAFQELGHVLAIAGETRELHGPIDLAVREQPQAPGIPVRVRYGGRVVALELLHLVTIGRGAAARSEHVRELQHDRGGTGPRGLELGDGLFTVSEVLELILDVGVVRHLPLNLGDVRLNLRVLLRDDLELVLLPLVEEDEAHGLEQEDARDDEEPELARVRDAAEPALCLTLLG